MRRSFYLLISCLVLCAVGFVFKKMNQAEPALQVKPEQFGQYVQIDLDLSDPNLMFCRHFSFNDSKNEPQTKNSPKSIDLDY